MNEVHPNRENTVPQLPGRIIRWLCKAPLQEFILGDLEEQYFEQLAYKGYHRARRRYWWQALKFLRPGMLKSFNGQKLKVNHMFQINLRIAFRFFKKNRTYTAINVLGLSTALGIAMLIIQYVRFERSYESHNPHAADMVRITMDYLDGEVVFHQDCETYPPLGPKIKNEFAEVQEFTRAYGVGELTLKVGENLFRESRMYGTDPSFFSMLHYPFLKGNQKTAFLAPYETVLTRSQALKFFGTVDVIGRMIEIPLDESALRVVGVINDPPANSHLKFNMLISYKTIEVFYEETDDNWGGNNTFTYLQLTDANQYPAFLQRLDQLNETLLEQNFLYSERVIAQPMKDIHLYSHKSFEAEINGDAQAVSFMLGVALLIILIALFNYINLSTAKALDRANEVGIRKVHGSSRGQLIAQFYTESFLMFLFAGVITLVLISVGLDYFRVLAGLPLTWPVLHDAKFWLLFVGLLTGGIFLSGSIPAFVLSSFQPATVLKGKFTHSKGGNRLRQVLVVAQFGITIFLLIQTLAANQQLNFMQNKDLGIESERVMVVNAPDDSNAAALQAFKGELLNQADFEQVAFTDATPGMPAHQMGTTSGIQPVDAVEKHNTNMYLYYIDHQFLDVLNITLAAGENFKKNGNEDKLIVNEEAIRQWGYADATAAVGKKLAFGDDHYTILGVIKDFHQFSPKDPLIPILFFPEEDGSSLICIRTGAGDPVQQIAALEKAYANHFPNDAFNFFFLDQEFGKQYAQDLRFQQVLSLLSSLAILIACLGLFGLASFTIAKRSKEIGIRKVLGASTRQIVTLISSQFIKLVAVAIVIAMPISVYLVSNWLLRYTFRIDLNPFLFIMPALAIVVVALVTVWTKTFKVSVSNPVESLRDE